ncbi:MAG: RNA polymerase sigma factor [Prevotella sp.]|jgi:RNA polymerase sigma-70 factor (ECF subfamily)|nr:RNA polymerase sigma factor [Prevotella sp.]
MKNISFRNDVLPLKDVLYRLALRITLKHEEAEDIVQDTLIKVWNKRDEWENIVSMEAYCLTICRNLALDKMKLRANQNESIENIHLDTPDQGGNPYERMQQKDRIDLVRRMVNALPEKQRSCIQLRDFEGKPYKEIAEILGITEEQVKVNIFRGRQAIKKRYQEFEGYGL